MKIKITMAIMIVAIVIGLMFISYDEGHRKGENQFLVEQLRPDTTGTKIAYLTADPYEVDIRIVMTPDTARGAKLVSYFTGTLVTGEDLEVEGLTVFPYEDKPGIPTVWLPSIPKTSYEKGVLSHEIDHIVNFVMNRAGIPLNDDTDEAYAYETGYLTRQIYDQIQTKDNRKN